MLAFPETGILDHILTIVINHFTTYGLVVAPNKVQKDYPVHYLGQTLQRQAIKPRLFQIS